MSSSIPLSWSRPLFIAGTGLSAFLAGNIVSISQLTVPALLTTNATPAIMVRLWRQVFEAGKAGNPPVAIIAALAHATNAYIHRKDSVARSNYFIAAAISTMAIVPYTFLMMASTNARLIAQDDGIVAAIDSAGAVELVKQWGLLNYGRGILPALGAVLAFLAL